MTKNTVERLERNRIEQKQFERTRKIENRAKNKKLQSKHQFDDNGQSQPFGKKQKQKTAQVEITFKSN